VEFTRKSLTSVLNDFYDAAWEEHERKQRKTKGKYLEPKRSKTRVGADGKKSTVFIYDELVPRAAFLSSLQMPDAWLRLWRAAIWSVLRERDRKRIPYTDRSAKKEVSLSAKIWSDLSELANPSRRTQARTRDISSSLYVGAEASNAECVPFRGRVDHNLLLHFWPVVTGVYRPVAIGRDGKSKYGGYVLAIPNVKDFGHFVSAFRQALGELGQETVNHQPRDSLIALPQEGALEYMHHLLALAKARQEAKGIVYSVAGIEVFCMTRKGNTVQISLADTVPVSGELLEGYDAIRGRYRHPIFRRQMVLNILAGRPWYSGFDRVFDINPYEHFLGKKNTFFQSDAARRFRLDNEEWREAHE